MNPTQSSKRRRRNLQLGAEALESRELLTGGAGNTFAIIPGAITTDGKMPVDLTAHLSQVQAKLEVVQSLSEVSIGLPFPEGWDDRPNKIMVSTGVPSIESKCLLETKSV